MGGSVRAVVARRVGTPEGFAWARRKNGEVVLTRHGRHATVLRGAKADAFVDDAVAASDTDLQELMARLTGNYEHGNERRGRRRGG